MSKLLAVNVFLDLLNSIKVRLGGNPGRVITMVCRDRYSFLPKAIRITSSICSAGRIIEKRPSSLRSVATFSSKESASKVSV